MNIENVILFQIERTSKVAKQYSQREFDRLAMGITVEQWILLKIIHECAPISQVGLAEKSLRDPASITRTLDLLQLKAFIIRHPIPNNRRQFDIALTQQGTDFVEQYMPIIQAHRELSVRGFTAEELALLQHLLSRIQDNMK